MTRLRRVGGCVALAACLLLATGCPSHPANVAGRWGGTITGMVYGERFGSIPYSGTFAAELVQDDIHVTGTWSCQILLEGFSRPQVIAGACDGEVQGGTLALTTYTGGGIFRYYVVLTLSGDSMSGTYAVSTSLGSESGRIDLARIAD